LYYCYFLSFVPFTTIFNPSNAELNLICHLLALLGAHSILHVSRIRVKEGKAIPLQSWTGPEGSMKLRRPEFMTIGT
jgi:hypothetical protein